MIRLIFFFVGGLLLLGAAAVLVLLGCILWHPDGLLPPMLHRKQPPAKKMQIGHYTTQLLLVLLVAIRIHPASAQEHPASVPETLQNAFLVVIAIAPNLSVFMRICMLVATSVDRCRKIFSTPGTSAQLMYSLVWLIYGMVNFKADISKVATMAFLLQSVLGSIYLLFIDNHWRRCVAIFMGIITLICVMFYFAIWQFGFVVPKSLEGPLSISGIVVFMFLQAYQFYDMTRPGYANGCVDGTCAVLDVAFDLVANALMAYLTFMWHRDMLYILIVSFIGAFCCGVRILLFVMQMVEDHGDRIEHVIHGDGIEHVNHGGEIELTPLEGAGGIAHV